MDARTIRTKIGRMDNGLWNCSRCGGGSRGRCSLHTSHHNDMTPRWHLTFQDPRNRLQLPPPRHVMTCQCQCSVSVSGTCVGVNLANCTWYGMVWVFASWNDCNIHVMNVENITDSQQPHISIKHGHTAHWSDHLPNTKHEQCWVKLTGTWNTK